MGLLSIIAFIFLFGNYGGLLIGGVAIVALFGFLYKKYTPLGNSKAASHGPKVLLPSLPSHHKPTNIHQSSSAVSNKTFEEVSIQIARKFGGRLTTVEFSLNSAFSLDEADEILQILVREGHASLTSSESGTPIYTFPGLLGNDTRTLEIQEQEITHPREHSRPDSSTEHIEHIEPKISFSMQELEHVFDEPDISQDDVELYSTSEGDDISGKEELQNQVLQWVPPGSKISVQGVEISDGMLYLMNGSTSFDEGDPAFIDMELPIEIGGDRQAYEPLHYFPSYADLDPEARAIYLVWLAGGRKDPNIDIGYVFLFFYGLERRVLVDIHKNGDCSSEIPQILAELKRLLTIYQENQSFYRYAKSFQLFILAKYHPEQIKVTRDELKDKTTFPFSLKYALAQFAVKKQALPAPVAFSWFERSPQAALRTPATRCRKEFFTLFKHRYHTRFSKGLLVNPSEKSLSVEYRPANASLSRNTFIYEFPELPDISSSVRSLSELQKVVESCIDDLVPFSRYIGRSSNQERPRILALAHLPGEILEDYQDSELEKLRAFLSDRLHGMNSIIVEGSEFITSLGFNSESELSSSESLLVAQLLGHLRYGLEPDVRFSGQRITAHRKLVLFPVSKIPAHAASAEYTSALLLLTLSALIVHADGIVSEAEENHLRAHISSVLSLTSEEQHRLNAHLELFLLEAPSWKAVKKHLQELNESSKTAISDFILALATSDGQVAPEEVDILKKIYELLERDTELLFSELHARQTRNSPEIESKTSTDNILGEGAGISLNMDVIAHTLQQTEQVQSLLAEVFEDEEEIPARNKEDILPLEIVQNLPSLDRAHSALFYQLVKFNNISRDDFAAVCKQHDVLPEGAIENLNSAAFDMVDEPLLEEDGDMLIIDRDIAKEMSI